MRFLLVTGGFLTATGGILRVCVVILLLRELPLLPGFRTERLHNLPAAGEVQPAADEDDGEVEEDVRPEEAVVAPVVRVVDVEARGVLVARGVLAVAAHAVGEGFDVAARARGVRPNVRLARVARWVVEDGEFLCLADDGDVVDDEAQEALEEVVEGRERVHPGAPEAREALGGHEHAAEADDEGEEDGDEQAGKEFVGAEARYRLAEADVEEFKGHDEEPDARARVRVAREADAPVPTAPVEGAGDERVGDFDEDGGDDKGHPGVDFRGAFARGVEGAEVEEFGLELLDQRRGDCQREED